MNDDGIFRNERPHEVVMPEGSHIAVSKSAEKTEPSVRKVFQEGEEFIDANLILEEGASTNIRSADDAVAFGSDVNVGAGAVLETDRIDHQTAEATLTRKAQELPAYIEINNVKPPPETIEGTISTAETQIIGSSADTQDAGRIGSPSGAMPEMDFPARVINLKIENDQLHERLDLLEQRNMP